MTEGSGVMSCSGLRSSGGYFGKVIPERTLPLRPSGSVTRPLELGAEPVAAGALLPMEKRRRPGSRPWARRAGRRMRTSPLFCERCNDQRPGEFVFCMVRGRGVGPGCTYSRLFARRVPPRLLSFDLLDPHWPVSRETRTSQGRRSARTV